MKFFHLRSIANPFVEPRPRNVSLPRGGFALLLIASLLVVPIQTATACSVPVFRFALERWTPGYYELTILRQGPLSEQDQKGLERTQSLIDDGVSHANVVVQEVDLSTADDAAKSRWSPTTKSLSADDFPQAILRFPIEANVADPLWMGRLKDLPAVLSMSPAAKQIVRHLSAGQTAVWVVVESGDRGRDDAAAAILEHELTRLKSHVKLPEPDPIDPPSLSSLPLKIDFSIVRISRKDSAENHLTQMFLRSEPDLAESVEPMVFPVFGRGRSLFALVGKGINAENIEHAVAFVTGACTCEVKQASPGFDLLLSASWDRLLDRQQAAERPAELYGLSEFLPAAKSPAEKKPEGAATSKDKQRAGTGKNANSDVLSASPDAASGQNSGVAPTGAPHETKESDSPKGQNIARHLDASPAGPQSTLLRNTLVVVISGFVLVAALTVMFFRRH